MVIYYFFTHFELHWNLFVGLTFVGDAMENNNKRMTSLPSTFTSPSDVLSIGDKELTFTEEADEGSDCTYSSFWCCARLVFHPRRHRIDRKMNGDNTFLTDDAAWQKLDHYFQATGRHLDMRQLFNQDPNRFSKFRLL